jgi:hypothetical protein
MSRVTKEKNACSKIYLLFTVVTEVLSQYATSSVPSYVLRTVVEEPTYNTVRCTQKLKSLSQSLYYVTEVNFVFCRLGNGDPLNNTTARIVFPRSGLVGHRPSTQVKSLLQIATVSKVTCVFVILHVNKQYHRLHSLSLPCKYYLRVAAVKKAFTFRKKYIAYHFRQGFNACHIVTLYSPVVTICTI